MISFDCRYFKKLSFNGGQIKNFINSSLHDLEIAESSKIQDVIFKFSYEALIKLGIALIAEKGYKTRSVPGHHIKILEKLSDILRDEDIVVLGNKMRQERNMNFYDGGF